MDKTYWLEKWMRQQCDKCYRNTGSIVAEGGCSTPDAEQTKCGNCRYDSRIRPDDQWQRLVGHYLPIEYRNVWRPLYKGKTLGKILHVFDDDMVYINVEMFGLPKFATITGDMVVCYGNWEFEVLISTGDDSKSLPPDRRT